jgi:hypothetical protein
VSELYLPSGTSLSATLVPTFEDRGSHVVSMTYTYGRILDVVDRNSILYTKYKLNPA